MDDESEAQKSAQIKSVFLIRRRDSWVWLRSLSDVCSAVQKQLGWKIFLSIQSLENTIKVYVFRSKRQTQTHYSLSTLCKKHWFHEHTWQIRPTFLRGRQQWGLGWSQELQKDFQYPLCLDWWTLVGWTTVTDAWKKQQVQDITLLPLQGASLFLIWSKKSSRNHSNIFVASYF